MYQASNEFNQKINSLSRIFRGYIQIGDLIISSKDDLISVDYSDDIYDESMIGTFISKTAKIKFYNRSGLRLENEQFDLFLGLELDNGTVEYVNMGSYVVDDITSEKVTKITTLESLDYSIYFNQTVEPQLLVFPATIDELIKQICSIVGVEMKSGIIYPNMDFLFDTEPYFNLDWQYRDAIRLLAESCGCYAKINRDNQLEIKQVIITDDYEISLDRSLYSDISVEENFGPVNSIVIAREPQNDNIYLRNDESINENGLTEIKIVNNTFIDQKRDIAIQSIYDAYLGFEYYPFSLTSNGNPCYDSGDIVQIKYIDLDSDLEVTSLSFIGKNSITYDGGFKQQIETPALTKTEINYDYATSIQKRLENAEIIVDKQQNTITSLVQEMTFIGIPIGIAPPETPRNGDYWLDTSTNIVMQWNGLEWIPTEYTGADVKDLVTIEKLGTELKQTIEDFNFTISSRGGVNLIQNSVGLNSINDWITTGNVEVIQSTYLSNDTISKSGFYLKNASMKQEIKVNIGETYTYTGRIATGSYEVNITIDNGGSVENVFEFKPYDKIGEVTYTFQANTNIIILTFDCPTEDTFLLVSDSVISEGRLKMKWQPYTNEIYTSNVKVDINGIEVGNSFSDIVSRITNSSFDILRANNEPAISVNPFETKLQKTVIEDDLTVGKMKMIVRKNRVDVIMLD